MAIVIILAILIIGSVIFSFVSPWWFTPLASNWGTIDDTLLITFIITGIVFTLLTLFMTYAVLRYRHRTDGKPSKPGEHRAHYEPESKKLEIWLTVITSVGIVAMLAPGLVVWERYISVPPSAAQVEVLGQQWSWTFRFPGRDGVFGKVDPRLASFENPFGIVPGDPNGQDDVLIEDFEVHLPIDRPVKLLLRSKDVLHDFYVPQFRAKMDLVPGQISYFWVTPTREGTYEILCAELCGVGHSEMRGYVVVEEAAAFESWLAEQPTFAEMTAEAKAIEIGEQDTTANSEVTAN